VSCRTGGTEFAILGRRRNGQDRDPVVDGVTKEVIRQIPNEEVLAIARAMDRLQGLLLKGKA
jgi:hypothetical protein